MRTLLTILAVLYFQNTWATNYYFSVKSGDDSRTIKQAQNPSTPWKSLSKLNSHFPNINSGDSILLNCGEIFTGYINIEKSGTTTQPIVISSYGTGAKPIISGFVSLKNWNYIGTGVWESTNSELNSYVNLLTLNGKLQPLGRFPNKNGGKGGYLTLKSHSGNSKITDHELSLNPNWTGGEIVIRKNRWIIDRNLILQHKGNTIHYTSGSGYSPTDNYGYFIQNHPATLDLPGEWCYDSLKKKVKINLGSNSPINSKVKISNTDNLISINNKKFIVIKNVKLIGSNIAAVNISNSSHISILNTDIDFSGTNAVSATNTSNVFINGVYINQTNNNALVLNNCSTSIIKKSKIYKTGTIPGMGSSGDDSYQAIILRGNNNLVEFNKIDSTGYIPIRFEGNFITIKNNFINYFTLIKDDGGGIYTWKGKSNKKSNTARKIIKNIVLNGKGARAGVGNDSTSLNSHGIYIDDYSDNVDIIGNSVADCSESGIYIHNSYKINIKDNTVYNNSNQLQIIHDGLAPDLFIRNIQVKNNVFFSKTAKQLSLNLFSLQNDIAKFGTFNSNYYCRPLDDNYVISTAHVNSGVFFNTIYDLTQWKLTFNFDTYSYKAPLKIKSYTIKNYKNENKFHNSNFSSNINGAYGWSSNKNGGIQWNNTKILDGGALKIDYKTNPGSKNHVIVSLNLTPLFASKNYVVKFSMVGETSNRVLEVFLRQTLHPYKAISEKKILKINKSRTEQEFVLSCNSSESNPSLVFEINSPNGAIWLDNIEVFEANVAFTKPDDYIRFEYNPTDITKNIPISKPYIDPKNKKYYSNYTLAPYSSTILMKSKSDGNASLIDTKDTNRFIVYPNPIKSNSITIGMTNLSQGNYSITIIDTTGHLVFEKAFIHSGGMYKETLILQNLSKALYYIKLKGENFSDSETIIQE